MKTHRQKFFEKWTSNKMKKKGKVLFNKTNMFHHNIVIGDIKTVPAIMHNRLLVNKNGVKLDTTITDEEYELIYQVIKACTGELE